MKRNSILLLTLAFLLLLSTSSYSLDINFNEVPLKEVIKIIASSEKINIVLDHKIPNDPVTLHLKNVEANDVLDILTKMFNLKIDNFSSNTIILYPGNKQSSYSPEKKEFLTLKTSYIETENLCKILKTSFNDYSFIPSSTYSLVVSGNFNKNDKKQIIELITSLDIPPAMIRFRLSFIDNNSIINKNSGVKFRINNTSNHDDNDININFSKPLNLEIEGNFSTSRSNSNSNKTFSGVVTASNSYSLFSGKQIPMVTSFNEYSSEIELKDVGNGLKIDLINGNSNIITLNVFMDISTLIDGYSNITGHNKISTSVALKPGTTAVIGGLINNEFVTGQDQIFLDRLKNSRGGSTIIIWADLVK